MRYPHYRYVTYTLSLNKLTRTCTVVLLRFKRSNMSNLSFSRYSLLLKYHVSKLFSATATATGR